ncbi:oxidoreductase [Allostella sp. ATCC 35155]|nr:oxidoreductase [Stella sp. ATCC 35155]
MITLRIDGGTAIAVGETQTLLQAALAAGADLAYGCQSGLCGACRVRLLQGEVEQAAHAAAALSDGERARGIVLACRSKALSDVWIARLPRPVRRPRPRRISAVVAEVRGLGPQVAGLLLDPPPGGLAFLPGQYAAVGFAAMPPRDFSFAGLPGDPRIEFHLGTGGSMRLAAAVASLVPGDPVILEGPFGVAHYCPEDPGPLVLVAGGTGLAPMLSVARAALAASPQRPTRLFRVRPPTGDDYGAERLRQLAEAHPTFVVDDLPSEAVVRTAAASWEGATVHAAGPPALVESVHRAAATSPGPPAVVRADAFTAVA